VRGISAPMDGGAGRVNVLFCPKDEWTVVAGISVGVMISAMIAAIHSRDSSLACFIQVNL
jgi:hypothetical protein